MQNDSSSRQTGFSLPEALVASVLMLVGAFGILSIFPQAQRSTKNAGRISVLNHLTAEKLEQLRLLGYTHADMAIGTHPAQDTDGQGSKYYAVDGFPVEYSLRWIVENGPTDQSGTPEPDMKTVTVEATYSVRYTAGGDEIEGPYSLAVSFQSYATD